MDETIEVRGDLILDQACISEHKMIHDLEQKGFGEIDKGKFLDSNKHLVTSKKFDNLITGFVFTSGFLIKRYEDLKKQLEKVIGIIDSQIE